MRGLVDSADLLLERARPGWPWPEDTLTFERALLPALRRALGPDTSVLNRDCRAHEVENLYAVDGSPFPTSTGVNPTLTIMANAWRVAEGIVDRHGAPA